jgi:hypothetical protein
LKGWYENLRIRRGFLEEKKKKTITHREMSTLAQATKFYKRNSENNVQYRINIAENKNLELHADDYLMQHC